MFNAEEIIELERKWLKYKIKQKSKFYIFFILFLLALSATTYQFYFQPNTHNKQPVIVKKAEKEIVTKEKVKEYIPIKTIATKEEKIKISQPVDKNETKIQKVKKVIKKNINTGTNAKSYYHKLEPKIQGNELFSSNGALTFYSPIDEKKTNLTADDKLIPPIQEIQKKEVLLIEKDNKPSISIGMKDMDTITYLKEKFYATSSIVFALMLSEEYYYNKNYNESLKWSLTANDIDSQNTKTWYWFAKSKVKLNQKNDAIRALKAYLANNKSKRLNTLLHKIERGDTDD
jgi:hypothetical protein